jgi:hypothetical protein
MGRNRMNPYWPWIKLAAIVALLLAVWTHGDRHGAAKVQAKFDKHLLADKTAEAAALRTVQEKERQLLAANVAAGEAYAKGKRDAEADAKHVADGLRAGTLKLRKLWQGCEAGRVSDAASGGSSADDAASRRADSAGRVIGAAHDDAEKIRALQKLLQDERK